MKVQLTVQIYALVFLEKYLLKDTHREKALSNKTPAFKESMNMDIWIVGTSINSLNQVLTMKRNFEKDDAVTGKNSVLCDRSILYSPFCLS